MSFTEISKVFVTVRIAITYRLSEDESVQKSFIFIYIVFLPQFIALCFWFFADLRFERFNESIHFMSKFK